MTVSETIKSGTDGTVFIYLSGTIAEVLQELADKNINAGRVVWYTDDATDARAFYCKTA